MKTWIMAFTIVFFFSACGSGGGGTSGGGSIEPKTTPITILSKTLQGGEDFILVRDNNGSVYGSGNNDRGQLGHVTTNSTVGTPEKIPTLSNIILLAAGYHHALALNSDGEVFAFGDNEMGALGLGDTVDRTVPEKIPGLPKIKDVGTGFAYSVVLDENGKVYAFGDNRYGQLGLGSADRDDHVQPVMIPLDEQIVAIHVGSYSVVMIDISGDVYAVGDYGWGELGSVGFNGTAGKIAELSHIAAASIGSNHALYLDVNGTVYASGRTTQGQLGLPGAGSEEYDSINTPTKIPEIPMAAMVTAGGDFSLVLDKNGEVWSFGKNTVGQLGLGDTTERRIPVKIPALSNIVLVQAHTYRAFAMDANGVVYTWGYGSDDWNTPEVVPNITGVTQ